MSIITQPNGSTIVDVATAPLTSTTTPLTATSKTQLTLKIHNGTGGLDSESIKVILN